MHFWSFIKYNIEDVNVIQKNTKAKKILICGIGLGEYNWISVCTNAKQIGDALQTIYKDVNQVKTSKIYMLTRQYKHFKMKEGKLSKWYIVGYLQLLTS